MLPAGSVDVIIINEIGKYYNIEGALIYNPALMTASALGVPLIILKKQPSKILNQDLYQTVVTSFTKETNYELTLSKNSKKD